MDTLRLNRHISHTFNLELEKLRSQVLSLGGLVEQLLQDAVYAISEADSQAGEQVVRHKLDVVQKEFEIDQFCTRMIARRQPAASDLRLVLTAIKTAMNLKRVGDEAIRIARSAASIEGESFAEVIVQDIAEMNAIASRMLRGSLDALARSNAQVARDVIALDDDLDHHFHQSRKRTQEMMQQTQSHIPKAMTLITVYRALERVGDRSTNIAEQVVYLVTGQDVRTGTTSSA